MIRIATIGTSPITESFINGCYIADEFELTAVYSRNYEKGMSFARKFDCRRVFTDLNDLANCTDIDAVYIASPNILHVMQTELMLANKKHVICEKPISTTCDDLERMIKIAKENGVVYMEAIMGRHLPARNIIIDSINLLGIVSHARFDFSQMSSKYQAYLDGEQPNIFNPRMAAGALMDIGIYCVYPAIDFFGVPTKISAGATFLKTGADGNGYAVLEYHDKIVELTYSKTGQGRTGSEIIGDKGTLVIDSISKFTDVKVINLAGIEEKLVGEIDKDTLMSGEAKSFANYILRMKDYTREYDDITQLAIKVHTTMDEIRKHANIKFI